MLGLRGCAAVVPVDVKRSPPPPAAVVVRPTAAAVKSDQLSFSEAFGALGIPMLLVVAVCILWTTWLLFLTCAPSWTANYLMNTASFDEGNFWLIVETASGLKVLSVLGLVLVALGYGYVLVKMLVRRDLVRVRLPESFTKRAILWESIHAKRWQWLPTKWRLADAQTRWRDLTAFDGSKRKYWVRSSMYQSTS